MTEQDHKKTPHSPLDKLPGGRKVRALHGAIEHSLTIQRDKLQQTVDGFVSGGKISREDAEELVSQLVTTSAGYSKALVDVLDSAVAEARKAASGTVNAVVEGAGGVVKKVAGKPGGGRSRR